MSLGACPVLLGPDPELAAFAGQAASAETGVFQGMEEGWGRGKATEHEGVIRDSAGGSGRPNLYTDDYNQSK